MSSISFVVVPGWKRDTEGREGGPRLACIVGPDSFGKTGVGKKGKEGKGKATLNGSVD